MKQRHKHADVIIAWAEGKDVQVWDFTQNRWGDVTTESPTWCEDWKYRIKPPIKKCRVALFESDTSIYYTSTADTLEEANSYEKGRGFVRWLTDWIEYEE